MRDIWWTCGCGLNQCWRKGGTPVCVSCGKTAAFAQEAPAAQGGFDFGVVAKKTGYEE